MTRGFHRIADRAREARANFQLRRMKPALFVTLLAFAGLGESAAPTVLARPVTGHWEAVARKEGRAWRFRIDIPSASEKPATVDFVDIAAYGVEFAVTRTKNNVRLERKSAAATTTVEGRLEGSRMTGRLVFSGIDAPFTGVRTDAAPPAVSEEAVSFTNGGVALSGTILFPAGEGPFPAIVCTHGSGPGDRQFAAYRSEGVFYSRLGLAALIYDRRGSGKSEGDAATASMEDLADDALAGVELLKTKKTVGATEIGVSGVSQGGWITPLAASRSKAVAFVVVRSASGIDPMDQSIFNVENVLRRAGQSESVVARATDLRKRLYELARSGVPDPGLPGALEAAHSEPWFKDSALPYPLSVASVSPGERRFLTFEPLPAWERVTVPVLAIWGGSDIEVPAGRSRDLIGAALERGGNRDRTLVLYPAADHALRIVRETGAPWDFPRTAPGARLLIAEWLRERVHAAGRARSGVEEWSP
jgi:pimeloyl-ACP methyl ester carboxylesterase